MSTAGILRASDVIFYHPLDSNFQEHTVSEVWTGTASSVAGKVGQAESAVTSSDIGVGALSTIEAGTTFDENVSITTTALSATTVVAFYGSNPPNGDDTGKARVGTVSGTTVTWGAAAAFRDSAVISACVQQRVSQLNSTQILVTYSRNAPLGGYVRVGTVSGSDITFGPESQFVSTRMNGTVEVLDSTRAVVLYKANNYGADTLAKVCTVSGTDVTFGPESIFDATSGTGEDRSFSLAALTSTTVVGGRAFGIGSDRVRVGTVSGTDITWGTAVGIGTITHIWLSLARLSDTTVVIGYTTNSRGRLRIGTVSGTDITLGAQSPLPMAAEPAYAVEIAALSSDTIAVAWYGGYSWDLTPLNATIGTVSGTDITFGAVTAYVPAGSSTNQRPDVTKLTSTRFILSGAIADTAEPDVGSAVAMVGSLDTSAGLTGTGALYPSAIGATRVTLAMWANNLTGGSSTVTVERGYSVAMTATAISLGGTTATWSGAGIASLMSTSPGGLNDGDSHLLVLDFENTGGTSWTLRTSADGVAFTNQGAQTSGTQAVTAADTDPSAAIAAGVGTTQWIDEMVMWAGDKASFDIFETQEMLNLFDLADTFGETMDQYENFSLISINIASDPSVTAITISPNDSDGNGSGTTPFSRNYASSTQVTLTAPATSGNRAFAGWRNSGGDTLSLSRSFVLTVSAAATVTAHYESIGDSRDDHNVASP